VLPACILIINYFVGQIPEISSISSDVELIQQVILENKNLVLADDVVRSSNLKPEQNTLILRDIPTSTPADDISAIFSGAVCSDGSPCPHVQSVRSDMNDTW